VLSDVLYFTGVVGGVTQWDITVGSVTSSTTFRAAVSYQSSSIAASINGGAVVADSSATIPTVTQIEMGGFIATGFISGNLGRITYYQSAQPDFLQEWSK
jgi:hypothetical protein